MKSHLSYLAEVLSSKFWLLPTLIIVLILGLLAATVRVESPLISGGIASTLFTHASTQSARHILAAIATAVMTVVGVLFSITIVVLQQVSSQYSPRVIENFIRSRVSQLVLGFYIGTFGYCLLLLRVMPEVETSAGSPSTRLSVSVAILLAMICLALLIYYIHHIAKAIKSIHILARVSHETVHSLKAMEQDVKAASCETQAEVRPEQLHHSETVRSSTNGYLQEIRWQRLGKLLKDRQWTAEIHVTPGDFLFKDISLVTVTTSRPLEPKTLRKVKSLFQVDLIRTHSQDPRFGIQQMVDVALRALSPGINDPSTAIEALNELGVVLNYFTVSCANAERITLANGCVIKFKRTSYEVFLSRCFDQIVNAAQGHRVVHERILEILLHCKSVTDDPYKQRLIRAKYNEVARAMLTAQQQAPRDLHEMRGTNVL